MSVRMSFCNKPIVNLSYNRAINVVIRGTVEMNDMEKDCFTGEDFILTEQFLFKLRKSI